MTLSQVLHTGYFRSISTSAANRCCKSKTDAEQRE